MATVQEIEDAIRKLAAKNPKDPGIAALARAREQMLSGGGGAPQQEEPSIMQRIMNSMAESGKNVREAVMNPGQSIPDALRTTSDFMTLGLTDRLRAGVKGTDYEAEKAETGAADERLGSIDEALNFGGAVFQPGARVREGAGALKSALAYGAENAGLSGAEAAIKGEDVLPAMAYGGAFGAGGSIAADAVGSVANIFKGSGKPKYKTDEDFFAAADEAPMNTRAGKDLNARKNRLEAARTAQSKGSAGFKDILSGVDKLGRKQQGIQRPEYEALVELAHAGNKKKDRLLSRANTVQGGTSWGQLPVSTLSAGVLPVVSNMMKTRARGMPDYSPKAYEKYTSQIRDTGERTPQFVTPEEIDLWRELVAKAAAGSQRGPR